MEAVNRTIVLANFLEMGNIFIRMSLDGGLQLKKKRILRFQGISSSMR